MVKTLNKEQHEFKCLNAFFRNLIEYIDCKEKNKKRQTQLKDEVWKYSGEEDTIDYVLFRIRELTGRLNQNKSNIIFPSFTLYYLYPYREFFLWYYLI